MNIIFAIFCAVGLIIEINRPKKETIIDKFATRERIYLNKRFERHINKYFTNKIFDWPRCSRNCSLFNFAENDVSICDEKCHYKIEKAYKEYLETKIPKDLAVSFDREFATYPIEENEDYIRYLESRLKLRKQELRKTWQLKNKNSLMR